MEENKHEMNEFNNMPEDLNFSLNKNQVSYQPLMDNGSNFSNNNYLNPHDINNSLIKEKIVNAPGGCFMLCISFIALLVTSGLCAFFCSFGNGLIAVGIIIGLFGFIATIVMCCGMYINDINVGVVLTLFGKYVGTVKKTGFLFINPFTSKTSISLKQQNFNGEVIKVNDKYGNPVMMGCVVVWRVFDTAKAIFEVANYNEYVHIQSEGAVREVGCLYPYDKLHEEDTITLKGEQYEVNKILVKLLSDRFKPAGIEVIEARITELSYAKEIAEVMLKTQAADAVIAARDKIVNGAVSIVGHALKSLDKNNVCKMSREQKAKLVSNMLVILCGESQNNQTSGASEMRGSHNY